MKRIFSILISSLLSFVAFAQQQSFYFEGGLVDDYRDLDAMVYHPQMDKNDELAALLKITFIDELGAPLRVDAGAGNLVLREMKPDGELWIYLSHNTTTLRFESAYYASPEAMQVNLIKGSVYRLKVRVNQAASGAQESMSEVAAEEYSESESLDVNYLKIILNKENATVWLGRTMGYELVSAEMVSGRLFTRLLEYGTYHYRIEHPQCSPLVGVVTVGAESSDLRLELKPNIPAVTIDSTPSGAMLFVNGREMGDTPCQVYDYEPNTDLEVVLVKEGYFPRREVIAVVGEGTRSFTFDLESRFAQVSCVCEDPLAELWLNGDKVGKGSWSGEVEVYTNHTLEARRDGYSTRRKTFRVGDNETNTYAVAAPTPMYGTVHIQSTPELCEVVIDGRSVGTTPFISKFVSGRHIVEIMCEGYESEVFEINLRSNVMNEYSRTLKKVEEKVAWSIPNNEIHYTSVDGGIVNPHKSGSFGARIVSNTYVNGKGVITFDKDVKIIGQEAFYYCENLKSVTLPATVGEIGWLAFAGCRNLSEFKAATASTDGRTIVMNGVLKAFAPAGLTHYVVAEGVREIGEGAFYICDRLEQVMMPRGVEVIGDSAFFGTALTDIIIPEGVKAIGYGICYECIDLATITLPSSLVKLGDYAFYGCESTIEIQMSSEVPPVMEIDVDGFNNSFEYRVADYRIYVPSESVELYRNAEGWQKYADKIFDINEKYAPEPTVEQPVEQPVEQTLPVATTEQSVTESPVNTEQPAEVQQPTESQNDATEQTTEPIVEEVSEENKIYVKVDEMPKFRGGDISKFRAWVIKRFQIPEQAMSYGVDGRLIVKFVVEKDGSIGNVEFLKTPDKLYNKEMLKVLERSPKWTPGYQDGKPARVVLIMPLDFKIKR